MEQVFDLLTAALLPGFGPRKHKELASRVSLAEGLAHPGHHPDIFTRAAQDQLRSGEARRRAERELALARERGAGIVGLGEQDYPEWLARIYDPPLVLYVRGTLVVGEGDRSLALVGSRAVTPQGAALTRAMGRDLALLGLTVLSGLARGTDTAAHRGVLDAKGRTVAVLGSGLDRVYPPENAALADAIAGEGALVSEFPFGTGPEPGHFPRRNRILAGWGRAVVVVEAGEKSGALITARLALEEGREVMAVPGHPSQPGATGTNQLIRDGAALVRNGADVAFELGLLPTQPAESPGEGLLGHLHRDQPRGLDEIQQRSGLTVPELLRQLSELELGAKVRRLPGTLFMRI
ncbi:MAG TPA: DNA-processing protein DprA [Vicinamibacteria bacterium]|nr:DNA-processing protein DprA [Vicinamibacteria bacterium]